MDFCVYHSKDLDGQCSGAIVNYFVSSCKFIGIDYGQELDLSFFDKEDTVYMVDFSLPLKEMIELSNRCNLIWIDHHKSSLEMDLEKFKGLALIHNQKEAACELTWKYFSNEKMPTAVYLLGRYDVWDHSNKDTCPFQYGMRLENRNPDSTIWNLLFHNAPPVIADIISNGKIILKYEQAQNERLCKSSAFEVTFHDLTFIVLNMLNGSSTTFDSVRDKYEHMLMFGFDGNKWRVSLRSISEDMSNIAKRYGGGGHAGAAGFSANKIGVKRGVLHVG